MKKILAAMIVILVGVSGYVGFKIWQKNHYDAAFYAAQVNLALRDNQPQKAFDLVNEGILLFPQHLDFRFGKIYMCQMLGDVTCMKDEMLKILQFSANNNNQWLWINEELKDNAFMLEVLQNYQKGLWENGNLAEMREIAEAVLNYFPDNVESLNTLAISYLVDGNWQEAEPYLKTAHQLNPNDEIVNKNLQKLAEIKKQQKEKEQESENKE